MRKSLIGILIICSLCSCFRSGGCCAVEKPATEFLNALRNKDFDLAKSYCDENVSRFIDSCLVHGEIIDINEVYDVKCEVKQKDAICTFCCLKDSIRPHFKMRVYKERRNTCNDWRVVDLSEFLFNK